MITHPSYTVTSIKLHVCWFLSSRMSSRASRPMGILCFVLIHVVSVCYHSHAFLQCKFSKEDLVNNGNFHGAVHCVID